MPQERHPSSSTANKARPGPYVISCMRFDLGLRAPDEVEEAYEAFWPNPVYADFVHEADKRLIELCNAVEQGEMTVEEAYEAFRPYAHLYPEMYTPEFREEWGDDFPQVGFGEDFTPVSEKFWHEATALNIPGVGTDLRTPSPASGLVFEVVGDEAFEELRSRLRDKYAFEIVQESLAQPITMRGLVLTMCGELREVTWPTTEQTRNLTLVMIAVCVATGTFLGVIDFVLGLLVRLVIGY